MARKKTSIDYDDAWIAVHFFDTDRTDMLAQAYNAAHGTDIRTETFRSHCYKMGLKRRTFYGLPFTLEEDAFLREHYPSMTDAELEDAFILRFGFRRDRQKIRLRCWYLGIQKRKDIWTQSRKESVRYDLGAEYENQGYVFVKVTHDGCASEKWRLKQRVVWEREHGKIPAGQIILFLDGNTRNCAIENLICVPKSYNGYINGNFLRRSESPGVTKAQVSWCALKEALKEG